MAYQWFKTQYPGVRYREHKERKHSGKPDRYYTIYYKLNGKTKEEGLGWASEGWTAQQASITLGELKKARASGEGAVTLKEKRDAAEEQRKEKQKQKAQEELNSLTLSEVADKYLEWAKGNKKTWDTDEIRLRVHVKPLLGGCALTQITANEVESFKIKCQEKGLSPASVVQCLALVRALFNYASRLSFYSGRNPVKDVKFPKLDNRRIRFLSREEAKKLLETVSGYNRELHDICLISLYTGIRSGEMAGLTWNDIDFEHELISIRDAKNGESRQVFMTRNVRDMLQRRFACAREVETFNPLVFPDRKGEERKRVSKQFEHLADKLGFNEGITDDRQKVVFHTLRHTFASWLAIQGETLLTIKELMGHKTIQMTMRYAHLIPDQKRKAVERLASC